jgi:hypothetical protein
LPMTGIGKLKSISECLKGVVGLNRSRGRVTEI